MKRLLNMFLVLALFLTISLSSGDVNADSISIPKIGTLNDSGGHVNSVEFSHDPYAHVLGVTSEWIDKFDSLGINNTPDWYATRSAMNSYTLLNMVNSTVSSSFSSSPSSSGSGGGSSGGGSGDGGGGSW